MDAAQKAPKLREAEMLIAAFNKRTFTVADGSVSYRVINHWTAEGLLTDERESPRGWRKFTLKDLMWLRILSELREFGVSLDKLKRTKLTLFQPVHGFADYLEAATVVCTQRMAIKTYLLVLANGQARLATQQDLDEADEFNSYPLSYARINLNILSREILFGASREERILEAKSDVSEDEQAVITALRGGHSDVRVSLNEGKITTIKGTRNLSEGEKIGEIAEQIRFGTISIQVHDGKPTSSKVTRRTRLKT